MRDAGGVGAGEVEPLVGHIQADGHADRADALALMRTSAPSSSSPWRELIDVDRQLEDLTAAVSFARALPDVMPTGSRCGARRWVPGMSCRWQPVIQPSPPVAQLPFMRVDPRHKSPRPASVTLKLFARAVRDGARARRGRSATAPARGAAVLR